MKGIYEIKRHVKMTLVRLFRYLKNDIFAFLISSVKSKMIDVTFRPSEAEHPRTVAGGIFHSGLTKIKGFFGLSHTEAVSLKTNRILPLTFRIMIIPL